MQSEVRITAVFAVVLALTVTVACDDSPEQSVELEADLGYLDVGVVDATAGCAPGEVSLYVSGVESRCVRVEDSCDALGCSQDESCLELGGNTVGYYCEPRRRLGEECDDDRSRATEGRCVAGAYCRDWPGRQPSTCWPRVENGAACDDVGGSMCKPGHTCRSGREGEPEGLHCLPTIQEGEPCRFFSECEPGYTCPADVFRCSPLGGAGDPCVDKGDCSTNGIDPGPLSEWVCRHEVVGECGGGRGCGGFEKCCITGDGTECVDQDRICEVPMGVCEPSGR